MLALLGTDSYSTVMDWISGEATPFALWEAIPFAAAVAFYFSLLMARGSDSACESDGSDSVGQGPPHGGGGVRSTPSLGPRSGFFLGV